MVNIYTRCARWGVSPSQAKRFVPCFHRTFSSWHAICTNDRAMPRIQSHDRDAIVEPAPAYASDAEIELAQQLRRRLEERYLGSSEAPSPSRDRSGEER
jgi:hypothetical protein